VERSQRRLALVVLCAAQLMLIVDVVALNVALPSMQRSLRIPVGQLQLVGVAYTLTFGSLLVVAGRTGDVFGRRRLFRIGIAVFTLASLVNVLAPNAPLLFAGRALQGIGAALVSPAALSMLTSSFPEGELRNRALGIWAAVGAVGAILGQVVGGTITDLFGWRTVFLINVPIGIAAASSVGRLVPESFGDRQRLDLRGAAMLTAALSVLTLSLTRVGEHDVDAVVVAGLAASALLLAWFWSTERRHSQPLVKPSLLAERGVHVGNGVLALLAGGTASALFFATLYLQGPLGYSPFSVGVAFAPVTVIVLLVSPMAAKHVGRIGARRMMLLGSGCIAVGLLVLSRMAAGGSYITDVLPGLALIALGNGLGYAPTMIAATAGVGDDDQGVASGLIGTSQELGTAISLAVVAPVAAAVARSASGPVAAIDGYQAGVLVAAGLVAAAIALALRTPPRLGLADAPVVDINPPIATEDAA